MRSVLSLSSSAACLNKSSIVSSLNSSIWCVLLTIYFASLRFSELTVKTCFFRSIALFILACFVLSAFSSIREFVGWEVFGLSSLKRAASFRAADSLSSRFYLRFNWPLTTGAAERPLPFLWWYLMLRMHLGLDCHGKRSFPYSSTLGFLPKRNSDLFGWFLISCFSSYVRF